MVPRTKEELRKLVSETTIEMYEEMTPQLIKLIDETKHNESLTEAQKQDEISLHMMGYTKACTNEIIIESQYKNSVNKVLSVLRQSMKIRVDFLLFTITVSV